MMVVKVSHTHGRCRALYQGTRAGREVTSGHAVAGTDHERQIGGDEEADGGADEQRCVGERP
jgi:hypothetical protein